MFKRYMPLLGLVILSACLSKEEQKDNAEEDGNFIIEKKSRFIKGIGEALKDEGKTAAETVSEGVGEVFKGVNKGFDKSLVKVDVRLSESLKGSMEIGRAGKFDKDSSNNVTLYAIFHQDLNGTLLLKAFDQDDAELGRVKKMVEKSADDAEYVDFKFDKRTPLDLAGYYVLDMKN